MKKTQQQPSLFDTELAKVETNLPVNVTIPIVSVIKAAESETKFEKPGDHMLQIWIGFAIPAWRRVLRESIAAGDKRREEYARKILRETLGVKDA